MTFFCKMINLDNLDKEIIIQEEDRNLIASKEKKKKWKNNYQKEKDYRKEKHNENYAKKKLKIEALKEEVKNFFENISEEKLLSCHFGMRIKTAKFYISIGVKELKY